MATKQPFQKAFVVPAQFARERHPGQVPKGFANKRDVAQVERAFAFPKAPTAAALARDTSPRLSPSSVVEGLGLDRAQSESYKKFIAETAKSSASEVAYRQGVIAKMQDDKLPADLRRVLADRALSYYRCCAKSFLELGDLSKGEPRGGQYHRRVPTETGGHRYYYDADKYNRRPDAHVAGAEVLAKRQGTQVAKQNGPGESLAEVSSAELAATLDQLQSKAKGGTDAGAAARIEAISAELERRAKKPMEKGELTPQKARQILHDKQVRGHPLTEQQRKFFGAKSKGAPVQKSQSVCEVVCGEAARHMGEHEERVERIDTAMSEAAKGNGGLGTGDEDEDEVEDEPVTKGLDAWLSKAEQPGDSGDRIAGHTADGEPIPMSAVLGRKPKPAAKAPAADAEPDLEDPQNVPAKFGEFHALHAKTTPEQHSAMATQATLAGQHGLAAAHANMAVAKRTGSINHFAAVQQNLDKHHADMRAQQAPPNAQQGPAMPFTPGVPAQSPNPSRTNAPGAPVGVTRPMPTGAPAQAVPGAVPPPVQPGQQPPQFRKSLETHDMDLDMWLRKAEGLPTGEPGLSEGVEVSRDEDGGKVAGVGKQSGEVPTVAGQEPGAPAPAKDKLSEDDAEDAQQMAPHEKPIEKLSKGLEWYQGRVIPQARNEFEARQLDAARISQLRKSQDSAVFVPAAPIRTPLAEEPMAKSAAFTVGRGDRSEALVRYDDNLDRYIEKSLQGPDADSFYTHGKPMTSRGVGTLEKSEGCPACGLRKSVALTACPHCGEGAVVQDLGRVNGGYLVKSDRPGPVLRRRYSAPQILTNGIVVVEE